MCTKRITFDLDILQIDKKKDILFLLSHSNCYQDRMSKIFFSFVHCWFFEESNSVEITLNTFLRLLYKYMVQKLLDLTRALFITTKIHTPRWRLQKFRGNFYFRNHIKRAVVFRDGDTFFAKVLQEHKCIWVISRVAKFFDLQSFSDLTTIATWECIFLFNVHICSFIKCASFTLL